MRLPRRKKADEIEELTREGEQRLAEARDVRERLQPKLRFQEQRHRTNAVYEEAAWVLTRGKAAR